MDYLLHWQMLLARQALVLGNSVAQIAAEMGYASESAFGAGLPPRERHHAKAGGTHAALPTQRKCLADVVGSGLYQLRCDSRDACSRTIATKAMNPAEGLRRPG